MLALCAAVIVLLAENVASGAFWSEVYTRSKSTTLPLLCGAASLRASFEEGSGETPDECGPPHPVTPIAKKTIANIARLK